jgi:hypothetical protein
MSLFVLSGATYGSARCSLDLSLSPNTVAHTKHGTHSESHSSVPFMSLHGGDDSSLTRGEV